MVIIWGQCIGLNPVTGILQKDASKMRFTRCSFQYLFAMTIAIAQIIGTLLSVYRLYNYPNVGVLGSVTFLAPACLTTISFIRTAPKWPPLMNKLTNSRLDEYIHPDVVKWCQIACAVYMGMCLVEHAMALLSRLMGILECSEGEVNVGEVFLKGTSPWLYDLNVPYDVWLGIILQNYVPASTWEVLREDYNRATKLIKLFDQVFSKMVLIAFGNDLFAICLQLYNVLRKVVKSSPLNNTICPGHDSSIFRTYIFPAYVTYSTIFLIARFLTLALVASGVHSSSLVARPVLYAVPTTSYCKEVERFQNQVNSGTVALSGLRFFYITRDLVLTNLYATTIVVAQMIGTVLSVYRLYKKPNVGILGSVVYLTTAFLTTFSFIRIAPKWPSLMNQLSNFRLDEYINPNIAKRCKIACAVYLGMGVAEHIMAILSRLIRILECYEGEVNVAELFMRSTTPWLYDLNVPYDVWLGTILQYFNIVSTATWNYLDIFIVCISLYLTSIMEQINKKISLTASKNYVSASTWGALREDYNRAANLVKLFDSVFSGLILIAFANDLFSICIQLYNVLGKVIRSPQLINKMCPRHDGSIFRIYIFPGYVTYSTIFMLVRFLTLALVASGVHSSSLVSLPVLYAVPSTSYCKEVERFQNQINNNTVALSGLHFFYITRNLILTVAGTIVTYELVLLQFNNDDR
ncbi:hypothetical protein PYW07_014332 [Mythimna separata]|uniref:Gustatory receptor n=1 Tax=Mythimna separata TaxID=271217 RepID=A0AAD8DZZ3_MYTSE|nr:hypothetical protein PYW07_014332 [Mythimna separata]